ncbi:MAG: energy transducer TonB [Balneola sp.]
MIKKTPKADLRSAHTIFVQIGIICSLLFMIAATNMNLESKPIGSFELPPDIDVVVIDIPPIIPPDTPPPPMKPTVFNEIPNNDPIEPEPIDFGPTDFDDPIPIPLKPDLKPDVDDFILTPEFMPEMKGGISKLYAEIGYPKQAKSAGIQGKVIVQFIVNKKGEVENPEILRGIGGGCDEEVLRAIKLMKFTPGIQNGNYVKVKMAQTVTFKLKK